MSTLSQFVGGSPIKSIQRGVITLNAAVDLQKSATISSVDTSKAAVSYLGTSTGNATGQAWQVHLALTSANQVTASRTANNAYTYVSYEVIEYN